MSHNLPTPAFRTEGKRLLLQPVSSFSSHSAPNGRSLKFWKFLVDGASDSVGLKRTKAKGVTVYVASSSSPLPFQMGDKTKVEVDKESCANDDLREKVLYFLAGSGYDVVDLGAGPPSSKAAELAKALQRNNDPTADDMRGLFLTGGGKISNVENDNPIVPLVAQSAALVANKHRGVVASVCHDVEGAKMSRSLLNTNVLVMKGDEDQAQNMIEGWIKQDVGAAPRSVVGETPEWWPEDVGVVKEFHDDYSSAVATAQDGEEEIVRKVADEEVVGKVA